MSTKPLVFICGYTPASEPGLHAFRFDESAGRLEKVGELAGIPKDSFMAVHPNGRWLYMASETDQGSVWALNYKAEPFSIKTVNHQSSRGAAPCHIQLDATGKWLFFANYSTGSAGVMPVRSDGSLGEATDYVQHKGSGPNPARQQAAYAHSATVTPDNRYVIIADLGMDQLVLYEFDAAAGRMNKHGAGRARPGAGPRHAAFHPNGHHLYVANELDCTVSLFDYDAAKGSLQERQHLTTLPPDAPETTVADIHLSDDGSRVYASNRGYDSLAVYSTGADGTLSPVAIQPSGGRTPRNFALSPGGRWVLVANQDSSEVAVLPLEPGTGTPGAPVSRVPAQGACCIKFVAGT